MLNKAINEAISCHNEAVSDSIQSPDMLRCTSHWQVVSRAGHQAILANLPDSHQEQTAEVACMAASACRLTEPRQSSKATLQGPRALVADSVSEACMTA